MTLLLVPGQVASIGQLGGDPLVPAGLQWPSCVSCDGAMTHMVQLGVDDRLLTMFQCENNPGMCSDWEPFAGGNAAVLVTGAAAPGHARVGVKDYRPIRVRVRQLAAPTTTSSPRPATGQTRPPLPRASGTSVDPRAGSRRTRRPTVPTVRPGRCGSSRSWIPAHTSSIPRERVVHPSVTTAPAMPSTAPPSMPPLGSGSADPSAGAYQHRMR